MKRQSKTFLGLILLVLTAIIGLAGATFVKAIIVSLVYCLFSGTTLAAFGFSGFLFVWFIMMGIWILLLFLYALFIAVLSGI